MINEHDKTKSMIDTMRSIKLIREDVGMNPRMGEPTVEEPTMETEPTEEPKSAQEIIILKDGEEMRGVEGSISGFWGTDKESFLQNVTSDVTFISYSITPKVGASEGDVKMTGTLTAYDIGFSMNKNASLGLRITTAPEGAQSSDVKLDNDVMKTLQKLNNYYGNWYKDWSTKLNTENFTNANNG